MTDEEIKDLNLSSLSDEEIVEIKKKAKDCCYRLSATEYFRMKKFYETHKECRVDPETGKHKFGAIGGGSSITFTPTGLGNLVSVKCHGCGSEIDITDIDCW